MLFSIIINTHNQYSQIDRCIKSCLNQEYIEDYEVIISDTSDKKTINKYSKKNVKIKIVESNSFSNFPCVDQMLSIKSVLGFATGKIICLLDGDDFFSPTKLNFLNENFSQDDMFLNQDNLVGFNEQTQKKFIINEKKKYKNNFIFNKLSNSWPKILGTSAITTNKEILDNFFSIVNASDWNFMAIDALLSIYFDNIKPITFMGDQLTYKSFHNQNLDGTYSNKFSKNYWTRRSQQHRYYQLINKKKYTNIDTLLSNFFSN
ncbi:glycosyltransferase family 2 protein [Candidatus Pelagibacter sp.]|nr:glycosyltransferase family 2 protein [Candidatus Pelagibacter sp.]